MFGSEAHGMDIHPCESFMSERTMDEFEAPQVDAKASNKALLAITIIGIVFGALGLCSGGAGCVGGVINYAAMDALGEAAVAALPSAQRAAYAEFMSANQVPQAMAAALSLVNLIVSILLLWGSVLALQSKQVKTSMLAMALAACLVHDCLKAALTVFNFFWLREPMAKYMEAMTSISGTPDFGLESIQSGAMGIGMVIAFLWIGASIAYYVWGLVTIKGQAEEAA